MSVTFDIESLPTGDYRLSPSCDTKPRTHTTYDHALATLVRHKATCTDCEAYGCFIVAVMDIETPGVNLANTNARMLLHRLDIPEADDLCGSMDAERFLGHVLTALLGANADDPAVPAAEYKMPGSATFIDCGVHAGYFHEKLTALADLAIQARTIGRDVVWS